MRVPDKQLYGTTERLVSRGRSDLASTSRQLSSGRRVSRAADDPTAAREVARLKSTLSRVMGFMDNVEHGRTLLGSSSSALDRVSDTLIRARSIAVAGADGGLTAEDRATLSQEVRALRRAVLTEANTKVKGRHVFAGNGDAQAPFADDGSYRGSSDPVQLELGPGLRQAVSLAGDAVFKAGATGVDVFDELASLADALENDDLDSIRNAFGGLDAAIEQVGQAKGQAAAILTTLEQSATSLERLEVDTESARSRVEDTDVPKKVVELSLQERALQAAMAVSPRVLNQGLVDFLR